MLRSGNSKKKIIRLATMFAVILVVVSVMLSLMQPGIALTGGDLTGSDPTADVETEETWKQSFSSAELTDNYNSNLVSIANTQIGYKESELNYYTVTETNEHKGYTRYGAFDNDNYMNWDTSFVDFCMNYAGYPEDVLGYFSNNVDTWIESLQLNDLYADTTTTEYQSGDLVFFQKANQETSKQVGIITEVNVREDGTYISVVEGNCDNEVKKNEYSINDTNIIGYALLHRVQEEQNHQQEQVSAVDYVADYAAEEVTYSDENAINDVSEQNDDTTAQNTIDERVVVNVTAKNPAEGKNGNTLYLNINSTCSNPTLEDDVKVRVDISELPDGVTIAGFSDGKMTVHYGTDTEQTMDVYLKMDAAGKYYVEFTQPAGATVNFDLTFNSKNGVMDKESTVTATPSIENATDKDRTSGPATLTWTGENKWQNLQKSVDSTKIRVVRDDSGKDQLVGKLTYNITAEQSNGDGKGDTGAIWTKEVTITDTLTLPEGIDFPAGAKVDETNKTIVDSNGNVLFQFKGLDKEKIESLSIEGKIIKYTIKIPNPNMENGVPTKEMDNVNLQCELDVSKLFVKENYTSQDQADEDKITNKAHIETTAYKGNDSYKDDKEVVSSPEINTGFKLTKSANKETVKAGETIEYTITIKNTGSLPISETDKQGNVKYVTDTLPEYLVLTDAQKAAITNAGGTISEDGRTISWPAGEISAGGEKTIKFSVNVKSAEEMKDVNDTNITNKAHYSDSTTSSTVKYKKPKLEIQKVSNKDKVNNGDVITYTVTIENQEDYETLEQTIEDTLQNGLIFQNMVDKNGNVIQIQDGKFNAESTKGTHEVTLNQNGQTLNWSLGKLQANEKITLYFTCKVDTDQFDSNQITNTAKSTTTKENSNTSKTDVQRPITVDKKVNNTDGGQTYQNGTVLDYSITMNNVQGDQASKKTDHILTDTLPAGLIPEGYKLYTNNSGKNWGTDLKVEDLTEQTLSFEDYLKNLNDWTEYYTVINNEIVKVKKQWGSQDLRSVQFSWYVGFLKPGESITKTYQAKIYMSDSQIEKGDKVQLTNTASIGGSSDSVTIYGKDASGILRLTKQVKGAIKYETLTDEQKNAIKFRITCSNPEYSKEISLAEFTRSDSENATYTLTKLPFGEYTIEEISSDLDGYTVKTTIESDSEEAQVIDKSIIFTLSENNSQEIKVKYKNQYTTSDPAKVDIQKSVWEIRDILFDQWGNEKDSRISNKSIFDKSENTGDKSGNYVIYNISVVNTGDKDVHIKDLIDELPNGLTFVGIQNSLDNSTISDFSQKITTANWNVASKINFAGENLIAGKEISVTDISNNIVTFQIGGTDGMDLEKGKAISFFVMCKVDSNVKLDEPLENTAKLLVDSSVSYNEYGTITMKGTENDSYQNNGGTTDEGINEDGQRVISSSVTITPTKAVVPGIRKTAKAYIETGKTGQDMNDITDENKKNNIQPQSTVKWEIELMNDGTVPIKEYTIQDTVDAPFYIVRKSDAEELQITGDSYKAFYIEIKDSKNNLIKTANLSEQVWNQIGTDKKQSFTLKINDSNLTIPVGGKAVFTVYTKNDDFANAIYTNDAIFTPTVDNDAKFDANSVKTGELVKDTTGKYTGVKASDSVYALGDYGSFSWKTIEEKADSSNHAVGYDANNNYIEIDDVNTDRMVVYSNNIENVSKNDFHDMVITDLMPYAGDTGVLNQKSRDSQFAVTYEGNLKVFVKNSESDTNPTELSTDSYTVKYSSKTSFTNEEMRGNLGNEWHDEWQEGDKSFCIVMNNEFILQPGQVLTMQYEGKIAANAKLNQIAWNSFGYRYNAKNATDIAYKELRAEPPKVGVKILYDNHTYELPSTGGTGTIQYYIGGAILMLLATSLYFYRKRQKPERRISS